MTLITSLSGHLSTTKNRAVQQEIREQFFYFVKFLQENSLTKRVLLALGEYPEQELVIRFSDLTDEGGEVVRAGYVKWLKGIDRGKSPSDLAVLEAALAKIRKKSKQK